MESYPHLSKIPKNKAEWLDALAELTRYLRSPEGCPWDRERTGREFSVFVREEAVELTEAIDGGDQEHIEEEFGDCLFTLLAAAAALEDEGRFRWEEALRKTHEKMIRRHGHVFGEDRAQTPEAAMDAWNRVKSEEKKRREKGAR